MLKTRKIMRKRKGYHNTDYGLKKKLSENLRKLREEKDISRSELSQRLGIDNGAYERWERGESLPSIPLIVKLADYYRVRLDTLLNRQVFSR